MGIRAMPEMTKFAHLTASRRADETPRLADVAVYLASVELDSWTNGRSLGATDRYLAPAGFGDDAAWCAAFVSWCYRSASWACMQPMPFPYSAWSRGIFSVLKSQGVTREFVERSLIQPGDLIFWWRVSPEHWRGHVGIIVQRSGNNLVTIEGNREGRVGMYEYSCCGLEQILGVAHMSAL